MAERPASERHEWQIPLSQGEVDRCGLGVIDERAKRFSAAERRIAEHLGVRPEAVSESLGFLCAAGLAEKEKRGEGYRITQAQVHLDPASPLIPRHHANWRLMAIRQLENPRPESFHYSSVVSLGEQEVFEVQRILTEAIERIRQRVRESPAERKSDAACPARHECRLADKILHGVPLPLSTDP